MNRYTFVDLSINGIKIDINDISDNNFINNRNNSYLDDCNGKKNTNYKVTPTKSPIYQNLYDNLLHSYNNDKRRYYSNNSEKHLNKPIDNDITTFNMKVNRILDDIRKKQEKEQIGKKINDKKEDFSKLRYKGLLDSIDKEIEEKEKNFESSIVRYKSKENSKLLILKKLFKRGTFSPVWPPNFGRRAPKLLIEKQKRLRKFAT